MPLSVLAFAGALRKDSLNRKLCSVAVERLRAAGAEVDHLDLREVDMPLYDGDLEAAAGLPAGAQELKRRIAAASAVFVASPEYNSSIPGTLKNAIDWSSRGKDQPWKGKVVALTAASPGPAGGGRMLPDLRKVLSVLGALVIPSFVAVSRATDAFETDGTLKDAGASRALDATIAQLLDVAKKLSA